MLASGSDQIGSAEIEESVRQVFEGQGGDIMPTAAEQWIEQGIEQGMQGGYETFVSSNCEAFSGQL